ncbi:MAG: class I SAM-dependent methyltransferase [Anabaena sp. CoA2_C59]|jgi:predicted O-methyltransferase YrrM|nr:class I SAM-dependent methyltransferase [Anabaena sp. CoA2_C59]MDJ0500556.1 class I SAM-dependent methyltransferase [Nostocales cyanobacterium LE14-WE4]MDJ0507135.1 class I SAM-dependent methyltransferase [Nostocales cyanobacterium LE14-WE12]NTW18370.1 class I SAM-dependent methyltransferase [Nostocales cyanobacterium W4_Combined_metabat2_030]
MSTTSNSLSFNPATVGKVSGTLFENVYRVIHSESHAQDFFEGKLSRHEWIDFLDRQRQLLVNAKIPSADVDFAKRYPGSINSFISTTYQDPTFQDWLLLPEDWQSVCQSAEQTIRGSFEHQSAATYIYPEEGYLMLTLAQAFRAKRAIFLGSYYGYWAAWAMAALELVGGTAVLLDPNEDCCALARHNLKSLYPNVAIEVVASTGQDYLANYDGDRYEPFDFVVLDAELPPDYPDENLRGKGLYYALLESVLPHLADRSLLVCHNILLNDQTGSEVLNAVVERNRKELKPFLELVQKNYQFFREIPTTEGMGVGLYHRGT